MNENQGEVTLRELRQFGCGLGILLLVVGAVLLWQGVLSGVAIIFAAFAVAHVFWWQWQGTRQLYAGWMAVARALSKVMTAVLLVFLYFVVLTPIALLARLFGKHFLDLQFKQACDSYWVLRKPGEQGHDCKKQY